MRRLKRTQGRGPVSLLGRPDFRFLLPRSLHPPAEQDVNTLKELTELKIGLLLDIVECSS
jgi:hypothetical protein